VKTLAYRIKKNRKAHYSLLNIDAPPAALAEMERQMAINEDILRFITIRVEELEEGQSAMLQKRDRDDRGERGERGDRFERSGGGGDRFDRGPRGDRPPRRDDARSSDVAGEA
jgi:small subunit ribosomal protein S6